MMNWLLDRLLGRWIDRRIAPRTKSVRIDLNGAAMTSEIVATMHAIAARSARHPRTRL
jgi:hypothetical protein